MQNKLRRMSSLTLFMLSMNAIIGSGWLFAPLYAARIAGSAAIVSWLVGGLATMLIALTFAELSTLLPISGGSAHIPQLSHGKFVSFIFSWAAWITTLMLAPIEVQAVLQYAAIYFPSLMHMINDVPHLTMTGYLWATILMMLLCVLNIFSYKGLVRFNFVLFVFKFFVILLTIFLILGINFNASNFADLSESVQNMDGWQAIFSAVATSGIVLAFNGFKSGVEMAGEAKNVARAIPLSTVGAVGACMLLYMLLQTCFIGALESSQLSQGWANLTFSGDLGPFVGLAAGLGLFWLLKLIYINAIISPLGAGLIYVTSTARILYAMSRIGYVPRFLSYLNKQHFPVWAIVINFLLGMLSFLPLPGWQSMVSFLVSAMIITYAMGPIALLSLRASMPEAKRPFRLPAAEINCFLAFYICNLFSYWTGWDIVSKLSIVLLVGIVLFTLAIIRSKVTLSAREYLAVSWLIPYLSGLVMISYFGSFGGKGIIPFGYDFFIIAIFSMVVFYVAMKTRLQISDEQFQRYVADEQLAHA